jgi:hypothetical protein
LRHFKIQAPYKTATQQMMIDTLTVKTWLTIQTEGLSLYLISRTKEVWYCVIEQCHLVLHSSTLSALGLWLGTGNYPNSITSLSIMTIQTKGCHCPVKYILCPSINLAITSAHGYWYTNNVSEAKYKLFVIAST